MTRNIIQIYLLSYKYVLRLKEIEKKKTPLFIYFGYYSLIDHITCKHFLPIQQVVFHSVNGFLCSTKGLSLIRLHLFTFAFVSFALGDRSKQTKTNLLQFISKSIPAIFSFRDFMVSGLIFRTLNHPEFIFDIRKLQFHSVTCNCPIVPISFTEESDFFPLYMLAFSIID